jgi:uncharacterized protein YciI
VTAPVGRWLVIAALDPADAARIAEARPHHLAHVQAHRDAIAFGGVVGPPGELPHEVCYVLDMASETDARRFVDDDPYLPHYTSVRIDPFGQRLPEPDPGAMP